MDPDRLPPQDRASEQAVLGFVLRHPDRFPDVRDALAGDDFYFDCHQRIFASLVRLHDARRPLDLLAVRADLAGRGDLENVGGEIYLAELSGAAGCSCEAAVGRVRETATRRAMIRVAEELVNDAYAGSAPADELLEDARSQFDRLANRVGAVESVTIAEVINDLLGEIDLRVAGKRRSGLETGFGETDRTLCGGLLVGGLTVLAARPSVGKTSLACHVSRNVCGRGGAVLFVSLEQQRLELGERITAGDAGVSGRRIRTGELESRHHDRISRAADRIRPWRMRVNDRRGQTAAQIASGARTAKRKLGGLDLIVVDYLDLVRPENGKVTRNDQVGESTRRLRDMAGELNAPVLLLCQLNREAAGDTGPPKLHHLRNSGEIEQHADAVLFLHRTGPIPSTGARDELELHVAKQRNGPLGVIPMEHESRVYTFAERLPI